MHLELESFVECEVYKVYFKVQINQPSKSEIDALSILRHLGISTRTIRIFLSLTSTGCLCPVE